MKLMNVILVIGAAACALLGKQAEAYVSWSPASMNKNRLTGPSLNLGGESSEGYEAILRLNKGRQLQVRQITNWRDGCCGRKMNNGLSACQTLVVMKFVTGALDSRR